jgi:hypothetical protein
MLLNLIRKNEYPMENLPIAAITGQFSPSCRRPSRLI